MLNQSGSSKQSQSSLSSHQRHLEEGAELNNLPTDSANAKASTVPVFSSLRFKLFVVLTLMFCSLAGVTLYSLWFQGRPLLESHATKLYEQVSIKLALDLSKKLEAAEGMVRQMASTASALPLDASLFKTVFNNTISESGIDSLLEGAGIWPAPGHFTKQISSMSFYWKKDFLSQTFSFSDSFYHGEAPEYWLQHWFTPNNYVEEYGVFWSNAYTDPFSLNPMITVSSPIYREGVFWGVASLNLQLEPLSLLFDQHLATHKGYAFALDRNNKFITFPKLDYIKVMRKQTNGAFYPDLVFAEEMANNQPKFRKIADILNRLYQEKLNVILNKENSQLLSLAESIHEMDTAVGFNNSLLVASHLLLDRLKNETYSVVAEHDIDTDFLLNQSSHLNIIPIQRSDWILVTVFPQSTVFKSSAELIRKISFTSIALFITFAFLIQISLKNIFLTRLQRMELSIAQTTKTEIGAGGFQKESMLLDEENNDELGQLARFINRRNERQDNLINSLSEQNQILNNESSKQKQTSVLLEEALASYQNLLDSIPARLLVMDSEGIIKKINQWEVPGLDDHPLLGRQFVTNFLPADEISTYKLSVLQRYNESPIRDFDIISIPLKHKKMIQFYSKKSNTILGILITRVRESSRNYSYIAIGIDNTQQRHIEQSLSKAKEKAEEENQRQMQLLNQVSHELRTPINAISGFSRRLEKKLRGEIAPRHLEVIRSIGKNAAHLLTIIDTLLDISSQPQKRVTKQKPVQLLEMIHSIKEQTDVLAEEKNIQINVDDSNEQNAMVLTDEQQLRHLIMLVIYFLIEVCHDAFLSMKISHANNTPHQILNIEIFFKTQTIHDPVIKKQMNLQPSGAKLDHKQNSILLVCQTLADSLGITLETHSPNEYCLNLILTIPEANQLTHDAEAS